MLIDESAKHPLKHASPTTRIDVGMDRDDNDEQLSKQPLTMVLIDDGRDTDVSALHTLKHSSPIILTDAGRVIDDSE